MHHILKINFPEWWENWDRAVFIKINVSGSNSVFDILMPFFRAAVVWAPLYIFLLVWAIVNFKKQGLYWILFFLLCVGCSDFIGNYGFKHNFERLRPCHDPALEGIMNNVLNRCSNGFSFISNHAVNHFSIAGFIFITIRQYIPYCFLFFIWAAIIGYAQIYVGVHYPSDVLFGSIIGVLIGIGFGNLFKKFYKFPIFDKQTTLYS